jgi:hypothetical protein
MGMFIEVLTHPSFWQNLMLKNRWDQTMTGFFLRSWNRKAQTTAIRQPTTPSVVWKRPFYPRNYPKWLQQPGTDDENHGIPDDSGRIFRLCNCPGSWVLSPWNGHQIGKNTIRNSILNHEMLGCQVGGVNCRNAFVSFKDRKSVELAKERWPSDGHGSGAARLGNNRHVQKKP